MATVLVIEDENDLRENILNILSFEGYTVHEAENGELGIQMARRYLPDIIVCDIMMPTLDGYDVLLGLRSDPVTSTIPFIFLTAKAGRDHLRSGMELGADDYIAKPFTYSELLTAITTRLERQKTIQAEHEATIANLRQAIVHALPPELRAPLTGVLGHAMRLINDADQLAPDQISTIAESILQASQHLHREIENYLLYAQLEIMQIDPQRVIVMREHQIARPDMIIATSAREKAAEFKREDDLELRLEAAEVQVSRDSLKRIVGEICDNAFRYSPAGTTVTVEAVVEHGVYALRVIDSGEGIAPDILEHVLAPPRFDRKLNPLAHTGLGLIIVNHLVKAHGGSLQVTGTPKQGTEVVVNLALVAPTDD